MCRIAGNELVMKNAQSVNACMKQMPWPWLESQTPLLEIEDNQRVQVLHNQVLGFWVIRIIVQFLGMYMIIRYLDP